MRKATFIVMLGIAVAVMAGMPSIKWKKTSIHLGNVTYRLSSQILPMKPSALLKQRVLVGVRMYNIQKMK